MTRCRWCLVTVTPCSCDAHRLNTRERGSYSTHRCTQRRCTQLKRITQETRTSALGFRPPNHVGILLRGLDLVVTQELSRTMHKNCPGMLSILYLVINGLVSLLVSFRFKPVDEECQWLNTCGLSGSRGYQYIWTWTEDPVLHLVVVITSVHLRSYCR